MRKLLLFTASLLVGALNVNAQSWESAAVGEGTFYLYNVGAQMYFCGANSWGTHASLNASGIDVTLAQLEDGTYTIDTQLSNGGNKNYLSDLWCDGVATGHAFVPVDGAENTYYILTAGDLYLGYDGTSTSLDTLREQSENAQWKLVTKEARIADLANATVGSPINATFLIEDPNFGRNDLRKSAWTYEASNFTLSGGNNENNCAESYHSTFTLSQMVGLPAGVYGMTAQGFYRQDGSDEENLPVFYLGDETVTFPVKTGTENSMSEASVSFTAGSYTTDAIFVKAEGDSMKIGARLENNTSLWCIWDNFQLTYYGASTTTEEAKNSALYTQLDELLAEAKEIDADENLSAAYKTDLEAAIAAGEAVTAETIETAVSDLSAAIATAKTYQNAANVLPQMKALTESTNVYTEEALNEYYTQWQTKYDEGTLTTEEASGLVDPYAGADWHTSPAYDSFLLSAWDEQDNYADYYINTWSTEGNTDGSGFQVPFFEYWTADASSLAADTLAAAMTNLPAGDYTVSAIVRVRINNNAVGSAPTGIYMQANDGELVSVCDGTRTFTVSEAGDTTYTQLYVDTIQVAGTVGEDSVLNIRFIVTDSTNVSWLAFQKVNYAAAAEEEQVLEIPVTVERYTKQGYTGQTVDLDFTDALAYLGIESVSEATVIGINVTNDSIVTDGMSAYDGWHNAAGDFQTWGDNAAVCVKFDPTSESAQLYDICDMGNDNVPAAGESFTCKWGLQANEKTVVYVITINFVDAPKVTYPIVKTITINHQEVEKTAYSGTTETFDVNEVIEALGAPDIASCSQFIVNVSDTSFVTNSTDGWRDANGDMANWGSTSGVCVKINDPASGTIDYIGCLDDTHVAGDVYHAMWAFVYNEQAVLIDVVITFATEEAVAINGVSNGESLKSAAIYNLSGQRVNSVTKGGIYIINGKKVLLK